VCLAAYRIDLIHNGQESLGNLAAAMKTPVVAGARRKEEPMRSPGFRTVATELDTKESRKNHGGRLTASYQSEAEGGQFAA